MKYWYIIVFDVNVPPYNETCRPLTVVQSWPESWVPSSVDLQKTDYYNTHYADM